MFVERRAGRDLRYHPCTVRAGPGTGPLPGALQCDINHIQSAAVSGHESFGGCVLRWYKALSQRLLEGKRMATDYDAPRRTETDDVSEDSLEELKARRNEAQSAVVDVDEVESAESFELPGRRPVRRGAVGAGDPEAGRRVHLLELLPGASPQSAREREERRDDLHGLRRLTAEPTRTVSPFASAAQCGKYAVRPAATDQPVGRRVVRVVEDHQDHGPDPGPVHHVGRRVQLAAQCRRLRRARHLGRA